MKIGMARYFYCINQSINQGYRHWTWVFKNLFNYNFNKIEKG